MAIQFLSWIEKIRKLTKQEEAEKNNEERVKKTSLLPCEDEIVDVPKVVFADRELEGEVAKWLFFTDLRIKSRNIEKRFGILLKSIGIDSSETCTLYHYDKNNFKFSCHFKHADHDAQVILRYGTMIDFGPEIDIIYPNERKTYEYYVGDEDRLPRLVIDSYVITNPSTGLSCYRFFYSTKAHFTFENDNYTFSVDIGCPNKTKSFDPFILEKEDSFREFVLQLTTPFDIVEIYKRLCETSIDDIERYPFITLIAEDSVAKKYFKVIDKIALANGKMQEFIRTKNGITIALDEKDTSSYILDEPLSELELSVSFDQEIDELKKLAKTLFENKNNK